MNKQMERLSCGCTQKLFCKTHFRVFFANKEEIVAMCAEYNLVVSPITISELAEALNVVELEECECHPSVCAHSIM